MIRHLVTGGTTPVLERWASCGGEFYDIMDLQDDAFKGLERELAKRFSQTISQNKYKRPQISQMNFQDPQLASIRSQNSGSQLTFGKLFCEALTRYGILCLGLFRLSTSARAILTARVSSARSQYQNDTHDPLGHHLSSNACSLEGIPQVQCSSKASSVKGQAQLPSFVASLHVPSVALSKDDDRSESSVRHKTATQPNFLAANSRYVITNPPIDFPVYKTDLVFCLTPHV
ncbi:unnamed protein product [Dibothriocephalus latus]|uniref:Ca2+-activated K+ channel Slowpoke-like C-terminal domain-containing protein n=1 Tax=Dibothriocephalus latus TaxID=60516 RepID=A0A3P7NST2_DIBLA|nr:unnamed protein product [Dibothriocephalus latus]